MSSATSIAPTGVHVSRARITITATFLGFIAALVPACENPQPPVSCGAIPQQTLTVGESVTVSACFDDPNGDVLVYAARSSDADIATATGSGSAVTVTAVSPGDAAVTIRADDPEGLTAEQTFAVLVPNRVPVVVGEIADRELAVEESMTLDVSEYFSEPDGQALRYEAAFGEGAIVGTLAGETVTIVAVAKGTAAVTLTATDPGGLSATVGFVVTVPNRGPVAEGTVESRMIEVGEAAMVDMAPFFSDPDGDELVYSVVTSDAELAAAVVEGSVITVTAVAKGSANVTVTATDPEDASVTQSFEVTVPNRVPEAVGTIPAQTVEVGGAAALDITPYFTDPDSDPLTYAVTTADAAVAEAVAGEGAVTVTALAKGHTTVMVTAMDAEGAQATQSFEVTVPNRPPLPVGTIPAQTVEVGEEASVELASFFADPDSDPLTYAVETTNAAVAAVSAAEGTVVVSAMAKGETVVTMTATDDEGLTATQSFAVTVPNRGPVAGDALPAQTIEVGEAAAIDVSSRFSDPDGDELSYAFKISNDAVATIESTGHLAVVRAVAKGETTVTVTATDTEAMAATLDFAVVVPNRGPVAMETIAAQSLFKDSVITVDFGSAFMDPDGDPLTHVVASSAPAVAQATVTDAVVTIASVGQGAATVAVRATDPEGMEATASFTVTVPNRAPYVPGRYSRYRIEQRDTLTLGVAQYFADPDGDALVVEAESSKERVVEAAVEGESLVLVAGRRGTATVTVTASDPWGLEVEQEFRVSVVRPGEGGGGGGNQPPTVTGAISARTVTDGEQFTLNVDGYFRDPNGDPLAFSATSADQDMVSATVSGSTLTVTGRGVGTADVTVIASDPGNLTATVSFGVTVVEHTGGNRSPTVTRMIETLTLRPDGTFGADLPSHFRDPDGDPMVFSASNTDDDVATVEVSDDGLKVTAVANGKTEVSVKATDSGNLSATIDFEANVRSPQENRAPEVHPNLPMLDKRFVPTAAYAIEAWWHFRDPDDDPLSYSAKSSNEAVARIEQSVPGDGVVLVRAVTDGEATITFTAEDPHGATAEQAFSFVVKNSDTPYVVEGREITALPSIPGQADTVEFIRHFWDDDLYGHGERLSYSASTTDSAIVGVYTWHTITGKHRQDYVEFTGKTAGKATVTMTATDLAGESVSMSFPATVDNNRPPVVQRAFPALPDLPLGDTLTFTLADYFEDPEDGDDFTYADSLDGDNVWVEIANGTLSIGTYSTTPILTLRRIWIKATDKGGKSVTQTFRVLVVLPASNDPDPESQQVVFSDQYALRGWGQHAWGGQTATTRSAPYRSRRETAFSWNQRDLS